MPFGDDLLLYLTTEVETDRSSITVLYVTNELTSKPANIQPEIAPVAPYSSVYDIFNSKIKLIQRITS
jgi:hypothetical protein